MRKISRLIAGLGLLGSFACAREGITMADWRGNPPQRGCPVHTTGSAEPAEPLPKFMMRIADRESVSAEPPLYLMDGNLLIGEPYLRPVDIVSVEVVTGAAAAMRYGVSPWRTVVLITTRWGQARGRS